VQRVFITGLGAVTPLGLTAPATWAAALAGKSGVRALTRFDASAFQTRIGAELDAFDPLVALDRKDARHLDRFAQIAVVAAAEALADSGLDLERADRDRVGVATATGIGGIETLLRENDILRERGPGRVNPHLVPMMMANAASGFLAVRYGVRGPNLTTVTACTSSAHALGEALGKVRAGEADVMLAGGSEAVLVPFAYAGFEAMRALSRRNDDPAGACRPFDLGRDGLVMGEGGAMLVLEAEEHARRRGARVYAELAGYGMSADAHHMVEPDPEGSGAALAMRRCLADAHAAADEVDYINAHATATVKGDIAETLAIRATFGAQADRLWVSSTKSMHGHLLGGAGAVELLLTTLAVRDGAVPPTINLTDPDPACDLDCVPNIARDRRLRAAMSNSFAFGGHNASLLVRAVDGGGR
jgi:3-oxoacyl-[acyl-carrier-protein] synthase II